MRENIKKSLFSVIFAIILVFTLTVTTFGFTAKADKVDISQRPEAIADVDVLEMTNILKQKSSNITENHQGWGGGASVGVFDEGDMSFKANTAVSAMYNLAADLPADDKNVVTEFSVNLDKADTVNNWFNWVFRIQGQDFASLLFRCDGAITIWSRTNNVFSSYQAEHGATAPFYPVAFMSQGAAINVAGNKIGIKIVSNNITAHIFTRLFSNNTWSDYALTNSFYMPSEMNHAVSPFYFSAGRAYKFSDIAVYSDGVAQMPDLSGYSSVIPDVPDGFMDNFIFGEDKAKVINGVLSAPTANGCYIIPSALAGKTTLYDKTLQENVNVIDVPVFAQVEAWPNVGSNHILVFSPKLNTETRAMVNVNIGVNVKGSAHAYNVFIEERANAEATFTRKNMINDIRTFIPSFNLSATDSSQRVRISTLSKGSNLALFLEYSSDSGETFTKPTLIYNNITIQATEPNFSVLSLNGGSGSYSNFKMYCLGDYANLYGIEDLVVTHLMENQKAKIEWKAFSGANGYKVEYSIDGKTSWIALQENTASTSFVFTVSSKNNHVFRVTPLGIDGIDGTLSEEKSVADYVALPKLGVSASITATVKYNQKAVITWLTVANTDEYLLEMKVSGGDFVKIYQGNALTYTTDNLISDMDAVTFRVRAIDIKELPTYENGDFLTGNAIKVEKADKSILTELTGVVAANKITLDEIAGAHYSIDGTTWVSDNVFDNLEYEKEYTLYARYAETETTKASESVSAKFTTGKNPITNDEPKEWCGSTTLTSGFGGLILIILVLSLFVIVINKKMFKN